MVLSVASDCNLPPLSQLTPLHIDTETSEKVCSLPALSSVFSHCNKISKTQDAYKENSFILVSFQMFKSEAVWFHCVGCGSRSELSHSPWGQEAKEAPVIPQSPSMTWPNDLKTSHKVASLKGSTESANIAPWRPLSTGVWETFELQAVSNCIAHTDCCFSYMAVFYSWVFITCCNMGVAGCIPSTRLPRLLHG